MLKVALALLLLPAAAGAASLTFTEDLRIDPTGTDAEFGAIAGVLVAPDGTIFVLDDGFGTIHAFDDAGRHLRSFGEQGEGPGDLPRYMQGAIDPDGNLLLAGSRSSIARLDPYGELVGSVPLPRSPSVHSLFTLDDGTIGMSWTCVDWYSEHPDPPELVHLFAPDGETLASFAGSSWWSDDYDMAWAASLLASRSCAAADGSSILFLQCNPFELRLYQRDGTLVASTREGLDDFVPEPRLPEVEGNSTRFSSAGGGAYGLVVVPGGDVLVSALRVDPEDLDHDYAAEPDFTPRVLRAVCVFDGQLGLRAQVRGRSVPALVAADGSGRLWAIDGPPGPIASLVRYTWDITD